MPITTKAKWSGFVLGTVLAASVFALSFVAHLIAQPIGTNTAPNKFPVSVFANIPTCSTGNAGLTWAITDSGTSPTANFWATVSTGGGSNFAVLTCDGTNWRIN